MATTLKLTEIEKIAFDALVKCGATETNATSLAHATAITEGYGIASHGLAYIPIYCEHLQCGKVNGQAKVKLEKVAPSMLRADADHGFAHPAIDAGFSQLEGLAKEQGIAALSIHNSYNCGVLGVHTYNLAKQGLTVLGYTNAPASIAPSGGSKVVLGTNPFSLCVPDGAGDIAFLLDQSASVIAKSEVMKHAREGKSIPDTWTLDSNGNPTTDPAEGLKGSMAPAGGYKGVGVALMTEIFAAVLTGATLGKDASPFSGTAGGPPSTGQFFIAINPALSSGGGFSANMQNLATAITDQDARLPGVNRLNNLKSAMENGVSVNETILERIAAL